MTSTRYNIDGTFQKDVYYDPYLSPNDGHYHHVYKTITTCYADGTTSWEYVYSDPLPVAGDYQTVLKEATGYFPNGSIKEKDVYSDPVLTTDGYYQSLHWTETFYNPDGTIKNVAVF